MKDIKLSIIIPVYNGESHIPAMLDMLGRQSENAFEAVFVNDGSRDGSLELMRNAEVGFELRVIDRPNGGASAARNTGIDAARGDYITFADVDDVIDNDFVRGCVENAQKHGVAVFSHTRVVNTDAHFDCEDRVARMEDAEVVLRMLMHNPTRFGVYDIVADAEFLRDSGVRFPEGYAYYEDYDFLFRLFNACEKIFMTGECHYCYKAAAGSAMNTFNTKRYKCLQLFDNNHSLYLRERPEFYAEFSKWFAARLRWSVVWQACVSMPVMKALKNCGGSQTRRAMRSLVSYPDKRVAVSAAVYLVCPPAFAIIMRRMGKRRTLIPEEAEK